MESMEYRIEQKRGNGWHSTGIVFTSLDDVTEVIERYARDYPDREYRIASRRVEEWRARAVA